MSTSTPPRNCYSCTHSRVCHMRIELAKQVNRFKYLAATPEEVKQTNAEIPASALDITVARACTEYQPQVEVEKKESSEGRCSFCHNFTEVNAAGYCPMCYERSR